MPYLNWKSAALEQEIDSHAAQDAEFRLRLGLGRESLAELTASLEELFEATEFRHVELRVDLPREWVIFWKRREGESRLLLAHPGPEEWVATVALERQHGVGIVRALRELGPGAELAVGSLGPIGAVSNVEIVIAGR